MKCGHCGTDYHPTTSSYVLGGDADARVWRIDCETCPSCDRLNMRRDT
jgi:hypothetical protein